MVYCNNVVVVWLATAYYCMGRVWFSLINYYECHNKVVKWPRISNWLVTSAGVYNLVSNLIKLKRSKGIINYTIIFQLFEIFYFYFWSAL